VDAAKNKHYRAVTQRSRFKARRALIRHTSTRHCRRPSTGTRTALDEEDSIAAPSDVLSASLERADDETDRLQREVVELVSHADPPYPVQVGVDVALLARFFERFADQAVAITRRLDYVITGELRTDRSADRNPDRRGVDSSAVVPHEPSAGWSADRSSTLGST